MASLRETLNSSKPYIAMVALQFGYAGMYIITMIGMKRGLSHWILVVYRHATATLVIAPFALAFERFVANNIYKLLAWTWSCLNIIYNLQWMLCFWFPRKVRPKMTRSVFLKVLLLGLLEYVILLTNASLVKYILYYDVLLSLSSI